VIRVVLVEEMRLLRAALAALLERDAEITVVNGFDEGTADVATASERRPDVAVVNADLLVGPALATATELERSVPCRSLILFDPRKPLLVPTESGVRPPSFVAHDVPGNVLATTVKRVAAGELVMDPRVVLAALTTGQSPFTRRELEVLALMADGVSVAEIAYRLSLSVGTVRNYLSAVMAKTKARNRIDAVRIARTGGWL